MVKIKTGTEKEELWKRYIFLCQEIYEDTGSSLKG